jgi:hypothetical protein
MKLSTQLRLTSSCDTNEYIQRKSMVIQAIVSRPTDQSHRERVRRRLLFGVPRGKGAAEAALFHAALPAPPAEPAPIHGRSCKRPWMGVE